MIGSWKSIPWKERIFQAIWSFFVGGFLGGITGSILIGGGLAAVSRKLIFGDWDVGYAWTIHDLSFWAVSFAQGAAGAYVANRLGIRKWIEEKALREIEYVDRFHPVATRAPGEPPTWYLSNESPHTG